MNYKIIFCFLSAIPYSIQPGHFIISPVYSRFFFLLLSLADFFCNNLSSQAQDRFPQTGQASFYASKFDGRSTSNGERFDNSKLTAAHRSLPFGTMVKVSNLKNGKWVIVRINDRGPHARNRIIDLSQEAARQLDIIRDGTALVRLEEETEKSEEKQIAPLIETSTNNSENTFLTGNTYSIWGTVRYPQGFTIQLFAFRSLENAKDKCKQVADSGLEEVFIQVGWEQEAKMYRVVYGTFADPETARAFKKYLSDKGYEGIVKKHFDKNPGGKN
jgi:rare lipoprotein A